MPGAGLHLLYDPAFDDPLDLNAEGRNPRNTAFIPWTTSAGEVKQFFPRVIELDCTKVAAYLLESDAALDDPLLEASITLAHAQTHGLSEPDTESDPSAGRSVCGWLVSLDSCNTIAQRFASSMRRRDPFVGHDYFLRMHDPRVQTQLWPGWTDEQKAGLLGMQLIWITQDSIGHLTVLRAPQLLLPEGEEGRLTQRALTSGFRPAPEQWAKTHRVALVNRLIELWRERIDQPLPRHATDELHRHVERGEAYGLDGADLQLYVMTALELHAGFDQDQHFRQAVAEATQEPGTLADLMQALPGEFWEQYTRQTDRP